MESINKARNDVKAGVAANVSDVTCWLYSLATKRAFRMDSPDVPGLSLTTQRVLTICYCCSNVGDVRCTSS